MFFTITFYTVVWAVVRKSDFKRGLKIQTIQQKKYDTTIFHLYSKAADTQWWFVKRKVER